MSGQQRQYFNPKDSMCVGKIEVVLKVQVEGEPSPRVFLSTANTPVGKCAGEVEFWMGKPTFIEQGKFKQSKTIEIFSSTQ
jgi:hypothetical protein